MNGGLLYIPKFVKQESDLEYGSVVTHENYNEKLNLNTVQGDYNTETLRQLFTESDPAKTFHIPYLDKRIDDDMAYINETFETHNKTITEAVQTVADMKEQVSINKTGISKIILGIIKAGHAKLADNLSGAATAGIHKYYGTDYEGTVGYHEVPDNIFAKDVGDSSVEISGIYFTPRENSITESMMTTDVKNKLNRTSITDYEELTSLPYIAGVRLVGDISLEDIGAQPVGNYLTKIPESYTAQMQTFAQAQASTALENALTIAADKYVTKTAFTDLQDKVETLKNDTSSTYAKVFVGNSTPSNPKNGDIWVNV